MAGHVNDKMQMTCRDCKAVRYVRMIELSRASRPRCLRCGGPVELSHNGQDRMAEGQTRTEQQRERWHKQQGQ
jgi:hypothetical protein